VPIENGGVILEPVLSKLYMFGLFINGSVTM